MAAALREDLKKRHPFDSLPQEAMLAIMRTSDLLENRFARLLRPYGLTPTQYNVLRILRGEGEPLPCLEIANRMIQVAPPITRVIDQLLKLALVTKTRCTTDRRVFRIALKPKAIQQLAQLDQPVLDLHSQLMQGIAANDLQQMLDTLESIRAVAESL